MCAIMGVSLPAGVDTAIRLVYDGLRQLQGRGQDGSGLFAVDVDDFRQAHKGLGLVPDVYPDSFLKLPAGAAIGHNRYATQGLPLAVNLQPHAARCRDGWIALASNGDLPRYAQYRQELERQSVPLETTNDGELLAWWLARAIDRCGSMPEAVRLLQQEVEGAYSAVALFGRRLFAFRDVRGFRPMVMSRLPNGGLAIASEQPAFDIHLADYSAYEEIPAGAIIEAVDGRLTIHEPGHPNTAACIFELMYFSRPDGEVFGLPVSLFRRRSGWRLGRLVQEILNLEQAVVAPVPDSSNEMAAGVSEVLKIPLVPALIRAHSSRRTFIESEQRVRDEGVRIKHNPDGWLVDGRDIVLVDDSIVRGTTMHSIVRMLRRRGARQVLLLIGSPPIRWPCFMGIATPTKAELIASRQSVDAIARYLEVDHLTYLSIAASQEAAGPLEDWERQGFTAYLGPQAAALQQQLVANQSRSFCTACFTGQYPLTILSEP